MSTGGEGGMLLLRDAGAWARAWSWKDHGKNPHKVMNPLPGNSFRWLHDGFGSNYRMTEMQPAIGLVPLETLPRWLSLRPLTSPLLARSDVHTSVLPSLLRISSSVFSFFYFFFFFFLS